MKTTNNSHQCAVSPIYIYYIYIWQQALAARKAIPLLYGERATCEYSSDGENSPLKAGNNTHGYSKSLSCCPLCLSPLFKPAATQLIYDSKDLLLPVFPHPSTFLMIPASLDSMLSRSWKYVPIPASRPHELAAYAMRWCPKPILMVPT